MLEECGAAGEVEGRVTASEMADLALYRPSMCRRASGEGCFFTYQTRGMIGSSILQETAERTARPASEYRESVFRSYAVYHLSTVRMPLSPKVIVWLAKTKLEITGKVSKSGVKCAVRIKTMAKLLSDIKLEEDVNDRTLHALSWGGL